VRERIFKPSDDKAFADEINSNRRQMPGPRHEYPEAARCRRGVSPSPGTMAESSRSGKLTEGSQGRNQETVLACLK